MRGIATNRELPSGHQLDFADALDGALRLRIEGAERFDFIVEQVDAERHRAPHGKDVEQRTADCQFAVLEHGLDSPVTIECQGFGKGLRIEGVPHL